MTQNASNADIYEKLGNLAARLDTLEKRSEKISEDLDRLVATVNQGKGAWWASTKVGVVAMLLASALFWGWEGLTEILRAWP